MKVEITMCCETQVIYEYGMELLDFRVFIKVEQTRLCLGPFILSDVQFSCSLSLNVVVLSYMFCEICYIITTIMYSETLMRVIQTIQECMYERGDDELIRNDDEVKSPNRVIRNTRVLCEEKQCRTTHALSMNTQNSRVPINHRTP